MRAAHGTLLSISLVALTGCLSLDLGQSSGDAGTTSSDGGAGTDAQDAAPGTGCVVDSLSGATLCRGIALCPGLLVDGDQFPDCGFRLSGAAIDLVCFCTNALCPMGTANTCNEARDLLETQTEVGVCTQVSEGRCAGSASPQQSQGQGGQGSMTGTCDKSCASECGGAPSCLQLCGC